MKKENMKRGSIVTIYQDPITKTNPEGKAALVCRISFELSNGPEQMEFWTVRFLGERETVQRNILVTK